MRSRRPAACRLHPAPAAVLLVTALLLAPWRTPPRPPAPTGQTPPLTAIDMVNGASGWGAGHGSVYRTTDEGEVWSSVGPPAAGPGAAEAPIGAAFLGAQDAWVVAVEAGSAVVNRTADAGATWAETSLDVGTAGAATAGFVDFADAQHGWIWLSEGLAMDGEGGQLLATADGGAHWSVVAAATADNPPGAIPFSGFKTGLAFQDASDGWLTLDAPLLAPGVVWVDATTDGGASWTQESLPPPAQGGSAFTAAARAPLFFPPAALLAVRLDQGGAGRTVVYSSRDGGRNWQAGQPVGSGALTLSFPSAAHGFGTDGVDMFVTADGGATWRSFVPAAGPQGLHGVTQLDFVSAADGFAIAPRDAATAILSTTDGGHHWETLR